MIDKPYLENQVKIIVLIFKKFFIQIVPTIIRISIKNKIKIQISDLFQFKNILHHNK
jgi:hypothetical protein